MNLMTKNYRSHEEKIQLQPKRLMPRLDLLHIHMCLHTHIWMYLLKKKERTPTFHAEMWICNPGCQRLPK